MRADLLLKALDAAQSISRWHTVRTVMQQNVAEHSYEVALIVARCGGSAAAITAALEHDLGECETGDTPAPFKRSHPDASVAVELAERAAQCRLGCALDDLPAEEAWLVKFADIVSGLRFAIREVELGNRAMRLPAARFNSYSYLHYLKRPGDVGAGGAAQLYATVRAEYDRLKENLDVSE